MIDLKTQNLLRTIVRREGRSLLQYVADSFPWTDNAGVAPLQRFKQMVDEDRASQAELVRFLGRQRVSAPFLGAYPMGFTSLNFVSFERLFPKLVAAVEKDAATLTQDLATFANPEARAAVQKVLDVKRRHLKSLQEMAGSFVPAPH